MRMEGGGEGRSDLEAGGTPVDELDGPLGLDGRDGRVDVLWHYIATIQQAHRHVLAVSGVAFHLQIRENDESELGDSKRDEGSRLQNILPIIAFVYSTSRKSSPSGWQVRSRSW